MKITIKNLPPSKNKYVNWHWAKRKRYHEEVRDEIWVEMVNQNIKNCKPLKKAKIIFRLYFKDNRRRDVQNYLGGGIIAILDSLVDLGIIADDSYDIIRQPVVEFYKNKDDPRCEIEIRNNHI
ncbi:MAG TPA: hypothetical protein ENN27_00025 [Candidatus Atribacteria bacterium]|nr:hypothetical protein [Candidatus Atribacteria bacterium]